VPVAGCGLLGGIVVWQLRGGGPARMCGWAVAWLGGGLVLTALRDIHGPAILAGALVGAVILRSSPLTPRRARA
jgi:hypothetical protein